MSSFFNELKRRNVFKVAAAYIIVGWLILQVGEVLGPALLLPGWINSALAFFIILGFPLAMFFAWAFEMTPEGIKKEKDVDRGESITHITSQKLNSLVIGLLVIALGYFAFDKFVLDPGRDAELISQAQQQAVEEVATKTQEPEMPDDNSIAVLPFVNMSDDASNEYFSDGITEELLNLLAKIPELKVTSRSSAFSFKGQNIHIPTVAEKLKVKHVLEGSVRKAGNRVRITAQLIEAGSDVHMWSETYDRELDDVFAIQDEIAREVVTVLQVQLLGEVPVIAETDSEAYALYLQGKHLYYLSENENLLAAINSFEDALEIDPNYAPAWVGLARIQRTQANWGIGDHNEGSERARQSVLKALELNDSLADAWAVLARIQWVYDWDWDRSEGTARTALQHGPNSAEALEIYALVARAQGNLTEALEYANKTVAIDPLNPFYLRTLALAHWALGDYASMREVFERAMELYPQRGGSAFNVAFALINEGRPEEALTVVEQETTEVFKHFAYAMAYHDLGRQNEAREELQYVIDDAADWLAYQIAELFAYQGDADSAFTWLETAIEKRDGGITYLVIDPILRPLHNDPRWEPLLAKTGLLPYWRDFQQNQAEAGS